MDLFTWSLRAIFHFSGKSSKSTQTLYAVQGKKKTFESHGRENQFVY